MATRRKLEQLRSCPATQPTYWLYAGASDVPFVWQILAFAVVRTCQILQPTFDLLPGRRRHPEPEVEPRYLVPGRHPPWSPPLAESRLHCIHKRGHYGSTTTHRLCTYRSRKRHDDNNDARPWRAIQSLHGHGIRRPVSLRIRNNHKRVPSRQAAARRRRRRSCAERSYPARIRAVCQDER